jgi:simple sugar transport system substrate-binding protein
MIVREVRYGPAVSEETRKRAEAAKAKFMEGTFNIYKGPMKDNTGKLVIPAGTEYDNRALWLEGMDWLAEGVIGSTRG